VAGSPNFFVRASTGAIQIGEWHHVVWQWDGTTDSGGVTLYVDGNLVGSGTAAATVSGRATDNFFIGPGEAQRGFVGKIARVEAYLAALTASQVKQQYELHKEAFAPFALPSSAVGYWPFNADVHDVQSNINGSMVRGR
jgi:hypothetical protein